LRASPACGWIVAAGALLACGGCGFKGPLYLPERNATVVTHPARSAQPASGPQQAPQGAPAPGPTPMSGAKSKGKSPGPPSAPAAPAPPPLD
jgi:predicted small lipoprotein YifL